MIFDLVLKSSDGVEHIWKFDNSIPSLTDPSGTTLSFDESFGQEFNDKMIPDFDPVSADTPVIGKSSFPRLIKLSFGLSCNYTCEYCSQAHSDSKDYAGQMNLIPEFVDNMSQWYSGGEDGKGLGTTLNLWGGEPLVYWKKIKNFVPLLKSKYPSMKVGMITNGSLFTREITDFINQYDISVAMSHDGPGQSVRGVDPFDDPEKKKIILDLYKSRTRKKMSFSAVMNDKNNDVPSIIRFFTELTGDPAVRVTEMDYVTPYDEGGVSVIPQTSKSSKKLFIKLREGMISDESKNASGIDKRTRGFLKEFRKKKPTEHIRQGCGLDKRDIITVDLEGNVVTCQNEVKGTTSYNGKDNVIGSLKDISSVKLDTATGWQYREGCKKCPVLRLCAGTCMVLDGPIFKEACRTSFVYNSAIMARALFSLTGLRLVRIEGDYFHSKILGK